LQNFAINFNVGSDAAKFAAKGILPVLSRVFPGTGAKDRSSGQQ